MNWPEAIKRFDIQRVYEDASLREPCLLKGEIVQDGLEWLANKNRPSLYLHGIPGCGKTFFMTALFRHLVEAGARDILYIKSDALCDKLQEAALGNLLNNKGYRVFEKDIIDKYSDVSILFLDDIGSERDTDRVRQKYGSIIDARVGNQLLTVYTSNLNIEQMALTLGERIASRLQVGIQMKFPEIDFRGSISLRGKKIERLVSSYDF